MGKGWAQEQVLESVPDPEWDPVPAEEGWVWVEGSV